MERMTGADAFYLHLETSTVPLHTLKVVVLEPGAAGPLTVASLRATIEPHLGVVRRSTQRVHVAPGCGGRPLWVDCEVDLADHVDETTAPTADRAGLDAVCAGLAEQHLDRSRPLWAMTLVHGLEDGRQAVVVRVHHAIADGMAALNTFLAVTTDVAGSSVAPTPAPAVRVVADADRVREVARGNLANARSLPDLARAAVAGRREASSFDDLDAVPTGLQAVRSSFNVRGGGDRVCASATLDLAQLKAIGRETGATLNGVLHAVLAGAMREEYAARGDRLDVPAVAAFGVAADLASERRWGNDIAQSAVWLRTDLADPVERLRETARSCLLAVDLRRRLGFETTRRGFGVAPRLLPKLREVFAPHVARTVNNITTANVRGPATQRWFGDVAVVEWISYAVAVAPADVNLTCYSYDGRLSMGLVATPEAMPDPHAFLARLPRAVEELLAAVTAPVDVLDEQVLTGA